MYVCTYDCGKHIEIKLMQCKELGAQNTDKYTLTEQSAAKN